MLFTKIFPKKLLFNKFFPTFMDGGKVFIIRLLPQEKQTKKNLPQVGKMSIYKPQVNKMFFGQTTGGQSIIPSLYIMKNHYIY